MKTIIRILAGVYLLVVMLLICSDAMMTMFDLSRGVQYAFNMGAIVLLIPFGLHFFLGLNAKEDER